MYLLTIVTYLIGLGPVVELKEFRTQAQCQAAQTFVANEMASASKTNVNLAPATVVKEGDVLTIVTAQQQQRARLSCLAL